eukprot:13709668-Ditylum_brightwellii.AAC.1
MTDNTTANRIVNGNIKQRRSRAIGMQFYWLKDCCKQGHVRSIGDLAKKTRVTTIPDITQSCTTWTCRFSICT